MASNSETGHAKNVANFAQLLINCTSYDGSFNPSNPAIQLPAMQNTLSQGKDSIASVTGRRGFSPMLLQPGAWHLNLLAS